MKSTNKITLGQIEQIKIENILNLAAQLSQKLETNDLAGLASETWVNAQNFAKKTYVQQKIADLVASSPAALDTLNELAAALGNDPNFSTTVLNQIAGKKDDFTVLPVAEGGTGKTSISNDKLLIGNAQGGFSEISKDQLKAAIATTLNDVAQNGSYSNVPIQIKKRVVVQGNGNVETGNGFRFIFDNTTEDTGMIYLVNPSDTVLSMLTMKVDTPTSAGVLFSTKVAGKMAENNNEFVTLKQLKQVEDNIPDPTPPDIEIKHITAYTGSTFQRLTLKNTGGLGVGFYKFPMSISSLETMCFIQMDTTKCYNSTAWDGFLPAAADNTDKILTLVINSIGTSPCPMHFAAYRNNLESAKPSDVSYIRLLSDGANWLRIG